MVLAEGHWRKKWYGSDGIRYVGTKGIFEVVSYL